MTNIDYIYYLLENKFSEEDNEDDLFEQPFDLIDVEEAVYEDKFAEDDYLDGGRSAG